MDRNQAAGFIVALNRVQLYVPPVLFESIIGNPVCKTLEAVANGLIELAPKPPEAEPAPQPAPATDPQ